MIRSILANDLLAQYPYECSQKEIEIISHSGSSTLILGRSGTGKTTCLIFKLLGRLYASSSISDSRPHRQLLLTRSERLAVHLNSYVAGLMRSLSVRDSDHIDSGILSQTLPRDLFQLRDDSFPIICTYDQFLLFVMRTLSLGEERSLPQEEDKLDSTEAFEETGMDGIEETEMDGIEEADDLDIELAPIEHEGTPEDSNSALDWSQIEKIQAQNLLDKYATKRHVDFYTFRLEYWPKLAALLKDKRITPELVFAEIMGVIKGSQSSSNTLRPLSRQEYLELNHRAAPNFNTESERSTVYDAFNKYQTLKTLANAFDGVDQVIDILRLIRQNKMLQDAFGAAFDEIFVDEVQDLRALDIKLLFTLLPNGRGFYFAGDTAQTISHDSHFRFQDLKSLFFDHFGAAARAVGQLQFAQPTLFTLAQNFRSHQGIVSLAATIMHMLWNGFPEMVDKLEPEIGVQGGPSPIFFLGCDAQTLLSRPSDPQITNKRLKSTGTQKEPEIHKVLLDFGAEQVILVRDEQTKASLEEQVEDTALVLTIVQCKGMEFDDVLLWNFFTDSAFPTGWRRVGALKNRSDDFDSRKYAAMCSELKLFYVSLTRARFRLSIIEADDTLALQVADILNRTAESRLVEVIRSSSQDFLQKLLSLRTTTKDPTYWSALGNQLLVNRSYAEAHKCFRIAKDKRGQSLAGAFLAEKQAISEEINGRKFLAESLFRQAGDAFMQLEQCRDASRIYERLGEPAIAAELLVEVGDFEDAARLFERAGHYGAASRNYDLSQNYDAARALRSGALIEQLVSYIRRNQSFMSSQSFKRHSIFCVRLLKLGQLQQKLCEPVIGLLGSLEEKEKWFVNYNMHRELIGLYELQSNWCKLFLLYYKSGNLFKALNTLQRVPDLHDLSADILDKAGRAMDHWSVGAIDDSQRNISSISSGLLQRLRSFGPRRFPRLKEWSSVFKHVAQHKRAPAVNDLDLDDDSLVKSYLHFHQVFSREGIESSPDIPSLPQSALIAMLSIAKELDPSALSSDSVVLLIAGIVVVDRLSDKIIALPWCKVPNLSKRRISDYPRIAAEWFLDQVTNGFLAFDSRAQVLWSAKWPSQCKNFLAIGICRKLQTNECHYNHRRLTPGDCDDKVSELRLICSLLGRFRVLYTKRIMNEDFNESFLRIRRRWLEKLIRTLTFVSSADCSSKSTAHARFVLSIDLRDMKGTNAPIVPSELESLFFHKIGRDWLEINNVSAVLEQMQLAELLKPPVRIRFRHALNAQLRYLEYQEQKAILRLMRPLENELTSPSPTKLRDNLRAFNGRFLALHIGEVMVFHAFTNLFERFVAYLVLKIQGHSVVLMPQSWIDLHLPEFSHFWSCDSPTFKSSDDIEIYRECLASIVEGFTRMLASLDPTTYPDLSAGFKLGRSTYQPRILHRRNTELLTLALINLAQSSSGSRWYQELTNRVSEVSIII